jgi:hypothetical protein
MYNRPSNITVFKANFQLISAIRLHIANVELLQAFYSGIVCTASLVVIFFLFNRLTRPAGMPFTILDPNKPIRQGGSSPKGSSLGMTVEVAQ